MGLFGLFSKKKSVKDRMQGKKTNVGGERLDRLTPSGDLPFGWGAYNEKFVKRVEDEDERDVNVFYHEKEPVKKYELMKKYFNGLEEKKKRYYKIGQCEGKFFEKHVCETAFMGNLKKEYTELKNNLRTLQKEYERMKHVQEVIFPKLRAELLVLISDNPGILQTEAYKHFDKDFKNYVSGVLSNMDSDGEIIRKKSGRTYSLTIGKTKKKPRA
jgi:hypothetical protein